jgi:hypothetical protein
VCGGVIGDAADGRGGKCDLLPGKRVRHGMRPFRERRTG